jgi:hypothetical protein
VKYWEIIADNLSKAGWSWGCVAARDREGRTIWIADAHGYGNRFIVRVDELLTAFLELESQLIRTQPNVGRCPTSFSVDRLLEFSSAL